MGRSTAATNLLRIKFIKANPGHTIEEYADLMNLKITTIKSIVCMNDLKYKYKRNFKNRDRRDLSWGQDGYFNPDAVKGEDTFLV